MGYIEREVTTITEVYTCDICTKERDFSDLDRCPVCSKDMCYTCFKSTYPVVDFVYPSKVCTNCFPYMEGIIKSYKDYKFRFDAGISMLRKDFDALRVGVVDGSS